MHAAIDDYKNNHTDIKTNLMIEKDQCMLKGIYKFYYIFVLD